MDKPERVKQKIVKKRKNEEENDEQSVDILESLNELSPIEKSKLSISDSDSESSPLGVSSRSESHTEGNNILSWERQQDHQFVIQNDHGAPKFPHRARLGSDNSTQFAPIPSSKHRERLGSDNSFQFYNNALSTISDGGVASGIGVPPFGNIGGPIRKRLDSSGSNFSNGSTGSFVGGGKSHIHFYDSDTSGGSVIFQKGVSASGGSKFHHWRQPSDTSILSNQSFDSSVESFTFGVGSPRNSSTTPKEPNILPSPKESPRKGASDTLESSSSVHLPYHERKMLRANYQRGAEDRTDVDKFKNVYNDELSPRNLPPTKPHRTPNHKSNIPSSYSHTVASMEAKHSLPRKYNNNLSPSNTIHHDEGANFRSKAPPQLNIIAPSPPLHTRSSSSSGKNLHAVGSISKKKGSGAGLPRSAPYSHLRRGSSADSISPDKDQPSSKNAKPIRAPRLDSHTRTGSSSNAQSPSIRRRSDSQDSTNYHNRSSSASFASGNGAVLSSLSDQLAKDVVHFFRGEKKREDGTKPKQPKHSRKTSSGGSGFFNGLFSDAGNNEGSTNNAGHKTSIEDAKTEYHQRNQEFLSKAKIVMAQQNNSSASPIQFNLRGNRSISPNYPKPTHRQLSSIDNDNWDDDAIIEDMSSRRSRDKYREDEGLESGFESGFDSRKYSDSTIASDMYSSNSRKDQYSSLRLKSPREGQKSKRRLQYDTSSKATTVKASGRRNQLYIDEYDYSDPYGHNQISDSQDLTFSSDNYSSSYTSSRSQDSNSESESSGFFFEPSESSSLLSPSGISSHEPYGTEKRDSSAKEKERYTRKDRRKAKLERENMEREIRYQELKRLKVEQQKFKATSQEKRSRRRKERTPGRSAQSKRRQRRDSPFDELSSSSASFSSGPFKKSKKKTKAKDLRMFTNERNRLVALWKEEHRREMEAIRKFEDENRWYKRFWRWIVKVTFPFRCRISKFNSSALMFFSNLPLTIGAVALAIATLGVVWFKFAEENLDSCVPVHFRSAECTFPEFPGCFLCDTSVAWYRHALNFFFICKILAAILALSFFLKLIIAFRVVVDELAFPTTSSPFGLICMTNVCVFAGRFGAIGQFLVAGSATLHLLFSCCFIYMTLAYHLYPDPSWYPNTVGIGLSAVKTWLYYPGPGIFLMAMSMLFLVCFFPVSLFRVTCNRKISAQVCWIQMSAPSIALYALTIMAQPTFEAEHPDVTNFQKIHRMVYLPMMHFMFFLSVIGALSSVQSLVVRWDTLRKKEFSPAFAAFCFPTLAHANAVQAYRSAVDAFSNIRPRSWIKDVIYVYWLFVLVAGSIKTIVISAKFFYHLPSWVQVDVADEEEPPAPNETMVSYVLGAGETLRQPFVSPVILQANETGVLVRRQTGTEDGRGMFVRTRRVTALGFEPTMNWSEMNEERELLLDWVAKNPPRRRRHTLSVPGMDFNNYNLDEEFGKGNSGVYDPEGLTTIRNIPFAAPRARASTAGQ